MSDDGVPYFEIEIVVRGLPVERETMTGLRADRPVLARVEVPVEAARAWSVYRHALDEILAPTGPRFLSGAEADRVHEQLQRVNP